MKQQPKNKNSYQYYNQQPKFLKKANSLSVKEQNKPNIVITPHQSSKYLNPQIQIDTSFKKIPETVHESNTQLLKELQNLKKNNQRKKDQLFGIHKHLRIQLVRNQKLRTEFAQSQIRMDQFKRKQIKKMKQQHQNHKQSPLFYNENGLSPFELILLGQTKITSIQGNICMVCFMDFQLNQRVLILPCGHFLHKQCGVQHLLYSKLCPACNQIVFFGE